MIIYSEISFGVGSLIDINFSLSIDRLDRICVDYNPIYERNTILVKIDQKPIEN